jgi:hypothetical protein
MVKAKTSNIFICSSLIDISEILDQININNLSNFQRSVTTDVQAYRLLTKIFERRKVIFLNSKLAHRPRNIFFWIKETIIILYLKFFFSRSKVDNVFFYAPMYDLLASYIVLKIFNKSKIVLSKPVFYEGISEYTPVYQKTLLNHLYSMFYGFDVIAYDNYRVKIFGDYIPGLAPEIISSFNLSEFAKMDEIKKIQKKYWINYDSHSIENKIIIVDQSCLDMKIIKNFEPRMKQINDILKSHKILIKERYIGNISEPNTVFENDSYPKLDAKFPAEFYNLLSSNCVIGIYSSALGRLAHDRRISLLNLFEYHNEDDRDQWKGYLDNLSNDIIYPDSLEEIKELIRDAK